MSCKSKPLDSKYAKDDSQDMEGEGKSTHAAFDSSPSLLPKKTGYDGPPDCLNSSTSC